MKDKETTDEVTACLLRNSRIHKTSSIDGSGVTRKARPAPRQTVHSSNSCARRANFRCRWKKIKKRKREEGGERRGRREKGRKREEKKKKKKQLKKKRFYL